VLTRAEALDQVATAPKRFVDLVGEFLKSHRKQTAEIHLKLALSFACIGFALAGIPLGLLVRRQNAATGFACGIVVALSYYLVIKGLQTQVRAGFLGWQAIWVPNLVLMALGAILWLRCRRAD